MAGAASFSVCTHLPAVSGSNVLKPVMLPPGRAKLCDEARADGIGDDDEDDRDRRRQRLQGGQTERAVGDDQVRGLGDDLLGHVLGVLRNAGIPPHVELHL